MTSIEKNSKRNLKTILILSEILLILLFLDTFRLTIVSGDSMQPSLHDNDILLVSTRTSIEAGDVVMIEAPYMNKKLIKRVAGTEGSSVIFTDGLVYIDGKYVARTESPDVEIELKENEYFVLGDNLENSMDSRDMEHLGIIAKEDIIGEMILKVISFK